jgi:serine/threonine protein kinase
MTERTSIARKCPPGLSVITKEGKKTFAGNGDEYALEEVLGEGSYGSVYRCVRARDSAIFAVKVIDTMRIGFVGGWNGIQAAQMMAAREVEALRQLQSHPHVISLVGGFFSETTNQIFIVTDFVPGGNMFAHIVQRTESLAEAEASNITAQLTDALSFCHSIGIVHRDLKLENVLVSNVDVRLVENKREDSCGGVWCTEEVFTIEICDFGFAKSLQGYTTRTPIGTGTYAAPEVKVPRKSNSGQLLKEQSNANGDITDQEAYDAFKADSFSLGVMVFVMLCLAFPPKDDDGSFKSHKVWPTLSLEAQSFISELLAVNPTARLSMAGACSHPWVKYQEQELSTCNQEQRVDSRGRAASKEKVKLVSAFAEPGLASCRRLPQPQWKSRQETQAATLPFVLALHQALVHIQQERGMACWALSGNTGIGGISPKDQLQWHMQLTEKRINEARSLLGGGFARQRSDDALENLFTDLRTARKQALSADGSEDIEATMRRTDCFDSVFTVYNSACSAMIEIVAKELEACRPGSSEGRRAARRYRLFSAAAEQLGRERSFVCGQNHMPDYDDMEGSTISLGSSITTRASGKKASRFPPDKLQRLAEITGARKILLGTAADAARSAADLVATSTGLLGTLIGGDEPALLSVSDIAALESLEQRFLAADSDDVVCIEEWFQTITALLTDIHSRIAMALVEAMRMPTPTPQADSLASAASPSSQMTPAFNRMDESNGDSKVSRTQFECGCRSGLKACLHFLAEKL